MVLQSEWAQIQIIFLSNERQSCGIGFSGSRSSGTIIRSIFPGGPADRDGNLHIGDHLLFIGDIRLSGVNAEQVASILRNENQSSTVRFVVARSIDPTFPTYPPHSTIVPSKILSDPKKLEQLLHTDLLVKDYKGLQNNLGNQEDNTQINGVETMSDNCSTTKICEEKKVANDITKIEKCELDEDFQKKCPIDVMNGNLTFYEYNENMLVQPYSFHQGGSNQTLSLEHPSPNTVSNSQISNLEVYDFGLAPLKPKNSNIVNRSNSSSASESVSTGETNQNGRMSTQLMKENRNSINLLDTRNYTSSADVLPVLNSKSRKKRFGVYFSHINSSKGVTNSMQKLSSYDSEFTTSNIHEKSQSHTSGQIKHRRSKSLFHRSHDRKFLVSECRSSRRQSNHHISSHEAAWYSNKRNSIQMSSLPKSITKIQLKQNSEGGILEIQEEAAKLIFDVQINKDTDGLGITVAGYVCEKEHLNGIFVKRIIEGSAAAKEGNIRINDQVIEVNGKSLCGLSNAEAIEVLKNTSKNVHLKFLRYMNGQDLDKIRKHDLIEIEINPSFKNEQKQDKMTQSDSFHFKANPSVLKHETFSESLKEPDSEAEVTQLPIHFSTDSPRLPIKEDFNYTSCLTKNQSSPSRLDSKSFKAKLVSVARIATERKTSMPARFEDVKNNLRVKWQNIVGPGYLILIADFVRPKSSVRGIGISLEGTVEVEDGREVRPKHYIRSILPQSCVDLNGNLMNGDELLEVNGTCLKGLEYDKVYNIMKNLPRNVNLVCARKIPSVGPGFLRGTIVDNVEIGNSKQAFNSRKILCGSLQSLFETPKKDLNMGGTGLPFGGLLRAKSDMSLSCSPSQSLSREPSPSLSPAFQTVTNNIEEDLKPCLDKSETGKTLRSEAQNNNNLDDLEEVIVDKTLDGFGFFLTDVMDASHNGEKILVIKDLKEDGPAHISGKLKIGDQIIGINSINLRHLSLAEAVEEMSNVPIGPVKLSLIKSRHKLNSPINEEIPSANENDVSGSKSPKTFAKSSHNNFMTVVETTPEGKSATLLSTSHTLVPLTEVSTSSTTSSSTTCGDDERLQLMTKYYETYNRYPIQHRGKKRNFSDYIPANLNILPNVNKYQICITRSANEYLGVHLEALSYESSGTVICGLERGGAIDVDGRLRIGDLMLYINNECLWKSTTSQVKLILRRAELVSTSIPIIFVPEEYLVSLEGPSTSLSSFIKGEKNPEPEPEPEILTSSNIDIGDAIQQNLTLQDHEDTSVGLNTDVLDLSVTSAFSKYSTELIACSIIDSDDEEESSDVREVDVYLNPGPTSDAVKQYSVGQQVLSSEIKDKSTGNLGGVFVNKELQNNAMDKYNQIIMDDLTSKPVIDTFNSENDAKNTEKEAQFIKPSFEAQSEDLSFANDVKETFSDLPGKIINVYLTKAEYGFGLALSGSKDLNKIATYICGINPEASASLEHLRIGDELLQIEEQIVHGFCHLNVSVILNKFPLGTRVHLVVLRTDSDFNKAAVSPPKQYDRIFQDIFSSKKYKTFKFKREICIQRVDENLGVMLIEGNHKNIGRGIFVSDIRENSLADQAGLMIGDLIIAVNSTDYTNIKYEDAVKTLMFASGTIRLLVTVPNLESPHGCLESQKMNNVQDVSSSFNQQQRQHDDYTEAPKIINFTKDSETGLGIDIIGGLDSPQKCILIHDVYEKGAADRDGRLMAGDQIISVNGINFCQLTYEQALNVLRATRDKVTIKVVGSSFSSFFEIKEVILTKKSGKGLGLSLKSRACGPGVYINDMVKHGVADSSASLCRGDQIIEVNGKDLQKASQEEVITILKTAANGIVSIKIRRYKAGGANK